MTMLVSFIAATISLVSLILEDSCLAAPMFEHKIAVGSPDGRKVWEVFPDSVQSRIFHRLPDYFEIVSNPDGSHEIAKRMSSDGSLIVTVSLAPLDWTQEVAELTSLLQMKFGVAPIVRPLFPRVTGIDVDPVLVEEFEAEVQNQFSTVDLLPGSRWTSRFKIPEGRVDRFVQRLVEGNGFNHLVRMEIKDPLSSLGQEQIHPFTLSAFVGGMRYCDLIPGLLCHGGQ